MKKELRNEFFYLLKNSNSKQLYGARYVYMGNLLKNLKSIDRNIWIQFIGGSMNSIALMMLLPFFALYLKDKVDSLTQVGIVMAISPLAAVIGSMLGGRLADIYGRKPLMLVSMVGNGIVMLGYIFFDHFIAYFVLNAFFGLLNSLFHPAVSAMVADVTEPEKRSEAYGLLRMGHNIGAALGPLFGASIIVLSKTVIFVIAASALFVYSLIVFLFIRETKPQYKEQEKGENPSLPSPFEVMLRDKLLLMFILTGVIISMGFSQTEGMLPLHLDKEMSHFSDEKNPYPYLMSLNGLLVVLFQFSISAWAGKRESGKVMLLGASLFGLGLLAVGWLPKWFGETEASYTFVLTILLIVYAVYTLGEMVMSPVQMTFVANIAPEHLRGTYMRAAGLQWIMGGMLGPLAGGFLFERSLGHLLFSILGIGCIIAGVIYLLIDRYHRNKTTNKTEDHLTIA
jgi:MFS family permease